MNLENMNVQARVLAYSAGFDGKDDKFVPYPKFTVRIGEELMVLPFVKGTVPANAADFVDKDVTLTIALQSFELKPSVKISAVVLL